LPGEKGRRRQRKVKFEKVLCRCCLVWIPFFAGMTKLKGEKNASIVVTGPEIMEGKKG
jgi:hypothetical protein